MGAEAMMCLGCPSLGRTRALGEIDAWTNMLGHVWSRDDVYVYRFAAIDVTIVTPREALYFVEAAGALFAHDFGLDTCAIAVDASRPTQTNIDIIMTRALPGPILGRLASIESYPAQISDTETIRARWPKLVLKGVVFGRLVDPVPVKHWRAQPLLWNHLLTDGGSGGWTNTYLRRDSYSIVMGKAEDGQKSVPWPLSPPEPPAPPKLSDVPLSPEPFTLGAGGIAVIAFGLLALIYMQNKV